MRVGGDWRGRGRGWGVNFKNCPKRKTGKLLFREQPQAAAAAGPQGGPLTGGVLPDAGG